ncbi:MAG: hypothetical protein VB143_01695 [Burkholderia sp.]
MGAAVGWRAVKGHHWPGLPRVLAEQEGRRVVAYGECGFNPCGGTHVAGAGEIGAVVITRVKEKKGQVSVQYELA